MDRQTDSDTGGHGFKLTSALVIFRSTTGSDQLLTYFRPKKTLDQWV